MLEMAVGLGERLEDEVGEADEDETEGKVSLVDELEAGMVEAGMEVTIGPDIPDVASAGSRDGDTDTSVLSIAESAVAAKAGRVALAAEAAAGGVHRPLLNVVAAAAAMPSESSPLSELSALLSPA